MNKINFRLINITFLVYSIIFGIIIIILNDDKYFEIIGYALITSYFLINSIEYKN